MKVLACLGVILGFLLLAFLSAVWWGYALSVLWTWFVVPLGVKAISIPHAYGLMLVGGMFLGARGIKDNNDKEQWIESIIQAIVIPAVALLFGWIVLGFM